MTETPSRQKGDETPVQFLSRIGAKSGDRLHGSATHDEGSVVIEITAVGKRVVVAQQIHLGFRVRETFWGFEHRDWTLEREYNK